MAEPPPAVWLTTATPDVVVTHLRKPTAVLGNDSGDPCILVASEDTESTAEVRTYWPGGAVES